ncbi:DUF3551 domain-containing protein [Bradyrhizobium sp. BRP20]|uniref:DUF3551 domain-containing protein n=1 Tax=Bradyrhizobium sp. BRP20 TaxID=2793822 RepID=UPI00320B4F98
MVGAFLFAAVISSGLATGGSPLRQEPPSCPATGNRHPGSLCLQERRWENPGNCQLSNYSQCMATASGTIDACGLNPTYAFKEWKGLRW